MAKKQQNREGVVYSTNPDYEYQQSPDDAQETLQPGQQQLTVSIDRKLRGGKSVTVVDGFIGTADDLKELARTLKNKCGVGGAEKDGQILIQGEFKDKIAEILKAGGYKVKLR
ncbi:MAG: translation initiation factor [Chitinophagales bacterium]|nr:translation initiation factor [Chitinophagales bacterium]